MTMATVTVDFSALDDLKARIAGVGKQIPFATAKALTQTAADVKADMPSVLDRLLSKPKPFTKTGTYVKPATKTDLVAEVGFKDVQARYLEPLLMGRARVEKPSEQKFLGRYFVPSKSLKTDQYGNVTKTTLLAILRAAQDRTLWRGRRVVVMDKDGLRPAGVYLATKDRAKVAKLEPLLIFTGEAPKYRKTIDLKSEVQRVVDAKFASNFSTAFAAAVASAR